MLLWFMSLKMKRRIINATNALALALALLVIINNKHSVAVHAVAAQKAFSGTPQIDVNRAGSPILVSLEAAPLQQVSLTAPTYKTPLQKVTTAANYGIFFNDDPKRIPLRLDDLFYYQYPANIYKSFYHPYTIADVYNGLVFGTEFNGACGRFNEGNYPDNFLRQQFTPQAALFLWLTQLSCNGAYALMTAVAKVVCAAAYRTQAGYCVQ